MPAQNFMSLNCLLAEYARLLIDPATGKACDLAAEKAIIEGIRTELEGRVRRYVNKVARWCPSDVREQAKQEFWVVFLTYLRRRRQEGTPVTVRAGKFIFLFVKYALHRRTFSPMENLNLVIHRLIQNAGEDPDALGCFLHDAFRRCVIKLVTKRKLVADPKHLTDKEEARINDATDTLEKKFHDEGIWHKPVWPVAPELMPRGSMPEYIDWDRFEWEALPLLGCTPAAAADGGPGDLSDQAPDGEAPLSESVWASSDRMKAAITARCRLLSQSASDHVLKANLRRLFVLLCLPYFRNEALFCSHYDVAGATKNDDKVFWAEVLVHGMTMTCLPDNPRQAAILRLAKDFVAYITPLIGYAWLWIPPDVRSELSCLCSKGNPDACAVLAAWWELASEQVSRLSRSGFVVLEAKDLPSPDLVYRRGGQDGLYLVRKGQA